MRELNERECVCVCVCVCVISCIGWGVAGLLIHKCVYTTATNITFFLKLVDVCKYAFTVQNYCRLPLGLFILEHHSISVSADNFSYSESWQQLFC